MTKRDEKTPDSNPDPITGEKGSHPLGVAGGGAGGAAAGAAIGAAVAGPVGALVGGAVGAVAGGAAGKGIAESVNPTAEDEYWRTEHRNRPYVNRDRSYEYYRPAYRFGWETATKPQYIGRHFEDIEPELEREWPTYRGSHDADWREVREATRDSYSRIHGRAGTPGVTTAAEPASISGSGGTGSPETVRKNQR